MAGLVVGPIAGGEAGKQATKGAGLLLIGPAVMGRLLETETFSKLLAEGFKATPGSQQSVVLAARLMRTVLKARKEINSKRAKARQQQSFRGQNIAAPPRQTQAFRGGSFR